MFLWDEFIFTIFEMNPFMQSGNTLAYASDLQDSNIFGPSCIW